jgi:hypothetical protein
MSRPEHIAPPDVFYNEDEAKKYGFKYVSLSQFFREIADHFLIFYFILILQPLLTRP